MSNTQIPGCIVMPSVNGSLTNCIRIDFPSVGTIIALLIMSWILFMVVAYIIYKFLNKSGKCVNYWAILGILLVSGIILSLISRLLMKL